MTTAKTPTSESSITPAFQLRLNFAAIEMSENQFLQLCADNGDFRMELTARKELIVMPPTWSTTGWRNSKLNQQLANWSDADGSGMVFDSNAGFTLPDGAVRSPDAAWVALTRWTAMSEGEQRGFANICPDFVIELRSPSDRIVELQEKMAEYMGNGTRLGWLIDTDNRRVDIYRAGEEVEVLHGPDAVSGESVLTGFVLDLTRIW